MLTLTGCGTGFSAQTNQQYDAAVGSNHRGGEIDVLNALFVDNADGTATFSAAILNKGTNVHILNSVMTTTDAGTAIASTLTKPQELRSQLVYSPGKKGDIVMTGSFPAGGFVKITLDFDGVAPLTINAPVVTRNSIYDNVAKRPAAPKSSARVKDIASLGN